MDTQPIQASERAGLLARLAGWFKPAGQPRADRVEPRLHASDGASIDTGASPTRIGAQSACIDPKLRAATAEEHATRLLAWLKDAFPQGGDIPAATVMEMHNEMMLEDQLHPQGWIPVARHLRQLTGGTKLYISQGRNRIRAYRIPPSSRAAGEVVALPTSRRMAA